MRQSKKNLGRPPHEPTPQTRATVEMLAAGAVDRRSIARCVGITPETLRKYYDEELATGKARLVQRCIQSLCAAAAKGNVTAAIYMLKARGGNAWKDRVMVEDREATEMLRAEMNILKTELTLLIKAFQKTFGARAEPTEMLIDAIESADRKIRAFVHQHQSAHMEGVNEAASTDSIPASGA